MYIYSTCEVRSLIDPLLWSLCGEASVFTDPRLPICIYVYMYMYIYSTCEVRSLMDPLLWSLCGEASVFTDPRLPIYIYMYICICIFIVPARCDR